MIDPSFFDQLEQTLTAKGPHVALVALCDRLREEKDYQALFYALLMKRRHELGVSPVPTGSASELPASAHAGYEEAIRDAGRTVGDLFLKDGNVGQAWAFFRMLDEPGPVKEALDTANPAEGDDLEPLVRVAFYEGVHPTKGFDWIVERYGICNAITTLSSQQIPAEPDARQYCLRRLVWALYDELRGRLVAEIERVEGKELAEASAPPRTLGVLRKLMEGRPWLFADDAYHIDTSHLSSVVQLSLELAPCDEMRAVRELCDYGKRLQGRFGHNGEPPFEDLYGAHDTYLSILLGENVEQGLRYFREKADAANEETGTFPAEVYVNLLTRLGRDAEALEVAKRCQAAARLNDLCRKANDFRPMAEAARAQGDPVHYLAGLLANGRR